MWRNWDEICWMSVIVSVLQNTWYPNYLVFRKSLEYISFLPSHYFPFLWLFNLTEKWHFFVLALWHAFALNSLQTLLNSLVAINTHNNVSEVLVIILGFRSLNHGFICLFIYLFFLWPVCFYCHFYELVLGSTSPLWSLFVEFSWVKVDWREGRWLKCIVDCLFFAFSSHHFHLERQDIKVAKWDLFVVISEGNTLCFLDS